MRVILADDAVLFREGMARILTEAGFLVTGQAGNASELLDLVDQDNADVAIIDIRMPPGHSAEGVEAAVEIRRRSPGVGLLLLSQHVETHYAMRLMTEFDGAVGYLLKDRVSDLASFANDVRRIGNGDCVIDPELVARLVAKKRERDPLGELTDRERAVLALMARGLSNKCLIDRTVSQRQDRRGPRSEHLHQARPSSGGHRSPAGARCSRVPARLIPDDGAAPTASAARSEKGSPAYVARAARFVARDRRSSPTPAAIAHNPTRPPPGNKKLKRSVNRKVPPASP